MGVAPQSLGNDPYRPEDSPSYDWFDIALTRLEAGVTNLDEALQGCPPELVDELRSLLEVGGGVLDLRHTTMPVRTVERHRKGKADFLAEAARYRPASAAPTKPVGFSVEPILNALQTWQERLAERFSLRMPQLVPLLASVAVVAMLAVNVVQVAQAAVPGDLTYPIKDWLRDVEVRMASVEERPELIARQEVEVRQDIEKALERDKTRVEPLEVTRRLTYYGRRGQLLDVGGLIIFDSNALTIDERNGALEPNAVVEVTFRILPGQESYVEGMRIAVVATPPPPTPLPIEQAPPPPTTRPTLVPTVARESETRCIPQRPAGWIRYRVRLGDSLSQIVVSGGGREVDVIRVNCLGGQTVYDGQTLYVPGTPGLIDQAEENEVPRPTTVPNPVATSTQQPGNTPLPTATILAPGTATAVGTTDPVDGAGLTPTSENETSPGAGTITATPLGAGGTEATPTSLGNNNATSAATPQPNTTPTIAETLDPAASPTAQGGEATPTVLPGTIEATATGGATTTAETTPGNGTPSEPGTTTTPKNETPVAGASPTAETPIPGTTAAPTADNATTNAPSPPTQETSTSPPTTPAQPEVVTQEPNPAAPAPPTADTSAAPVATVAPEVPIQPTPQTDAGSTGGTDGTQSGSGGTTGGGQPAQPAAPTSAPAPPAPTQPPPAPPAPAPEPIQPDPTSAGP